MQKEKARYQATSGKKGLTTTGTTKSAPAQPENWERKKSEKKNCPN